MLLSNPNKIESLSYSGDVIIVAWEYLSAGPSPLPFTDARDILVWRLHWAGNHWGLNNYSRVNVNTVFGQVIPSVSGRYNSSGAASADCYYLFVDQPSDRLYFKGSYYHNFSLRSVKTGTNGYEKSISSLQSERISIFPNPAVDMLKVEGLSEEASIQVFDRLGRKILSKLVAKDENQILFPENMPIGTYILEVQQANKEVKRFSFINNRSLASTKFSPNFLSERT